MGHGNAAVRWLAGLGSVPGEEGNVPGLDLLTLVHVVALGAELLGDGV